jgi:ribA/ribD-fused uncharacterized protein
MKTKNVEEQEAIRAAPTAGIAKVYGRTVEKIRDGWDGYKVAFMREIVRAKFNQHPELMEKLLATGDDVLVEGNDWGDRFWGKVKRENGLWMGENWLGKILMEVREEAKG